MAGGPDDGPQGDGRLVAMLGGAAAIGAWLVMLWWMFGEVL